MAYIIVLTFYVFSISCAHSTERRADDDDRLELLIQSQAKSIQILQSRLDAVESDLGK